jgi:hypothetical protein
MQIITTLKTASRTGMPWQRVQASWLVVDYQSPSAKVRKEQYILQTVYIFAVRELWQLDV